MFRKQIRITLPGMMPKIIRAVRRGMILTAAAMFWSCADGDAPGRVLSTDRIAFHASATASGGSRSDSIASGRSFPESIAVKIQGRPDSLYIHTVVSDRVSSESRGVPVASLSDYGSFGVFAHLYSGAWEQASPTLSSPYMNDIKVTEGSDGIWNPQGLYYWPAKGHNIRFFAYAPHGTAAYSGETGNITYTVPAEVTDQPDLLAACSGEYAGGDAHSAVPLAFRHILTAVKFSTGDGMLPGKITRITLRGVHGAGEYDFTAAAWQLTSRHDFTFTQPLESQLDGTPDVPITTPAATFMMMPQTLPAGAKITLEFTDNISGVKNTISADISGTVWEQGKTVEYLLSTTSIEIVPTLKVEVTTDHFTYKGGTSSVKVTSYADFRNKGTSYFTKPMPWTARFYAYNAATGQYDQPLSSRPTWITSFTGAASSTSDTHTSDCTVAAQSYMIVDETTVNLRNATTKGSSSNRYNLSTKGGSRSMTTANCYVVDAAGYYCLPLIYGNAIKNGAYNTSAYTCNASVSAGNLTSMIRHDGNAITNPYILANFSGPFTAELGWTDIPGGCITVQSNTQDYTLTVNGASQSGIPHILFNVNKTNISSGNALILLKKGNEVVWSWHIWITDMADETLAIANRKILPVLLGWSHDGIRKYDERSVKIVYTQQESNATQEIVLTQEEHEDGDYGTCTFYQWGRKDPMIGRNVNTNITWYDKNNTASTEMLTIYPSAFQTPAITAFIKNPWAFSNNPLARPGYHNMWSQTNNKAHAANATGVKTVYDPCPPGYRVPVNKEFTDILINNANRSWDKVRKTWRFTTNKSGKTAFFPMVGARDKTGTLIGFQERCNVWSAETYPVYSYMFYTNSSRLWLSTTADAGADGDYTSNGASIIAVGE